MISENKRRILLCVTTVDVTENSDSTMAGETTVLIGTADADATTITTTTTLRCMKRNV